MQKPGSGLVSFFKLSQAAVQRRPEPKTQTKLNLQKLNKMAGNQRIENLMVASTLETNRFAAPWGTSILLSGHCDRPQLLPGILEPAGHQQSNPATFDAMGTAPV